MIRHVNTAAQVVLCTIEDLLGDSHTLLGYRSVLSRNVRHEVGDFSSFRTTVGLTNGRVQVEVKLTKISAGHDTINTTIKRITGLCSKIDNLLKLAVWWVVVQLILNKLRPKVLNLLEGEVHSRRSNDSTVEIREFEPGSIPHGPLQSIRHSRTIAWYPTCYRKTLSDPCQSDSSH